MSKFILIALTILSLQSYAAVMPNDSVAKQVQDSLNRSAWVLGWNEGEWIDSIRMPYFVSEEIKNELLSKTIDEWLDILSNGSEEEQQKARSALGVSYLFGVGVEQSEDFGLLYLKTAADKGRAGSAVYVAIAYAGGVGKLTEDSVEALKWYKLADKLNQTSENEFDLGAVYLRAAEQATTRKDYKQAAEIHKESLELGHKQSASYLVALYAAGLGVEKDMNKALMYAKQVDVRTLFDNDADYNKFGNKLSPETITALIGFNVADLHKDIYKRSSAHNQARLVLDKILREDDPIGFYVAYKTAIEVNDMKYAEYAIHKAADAGIPAAQYELAENWDRASINTELASKMFKKAAESGYGKAYLKYGSSLYNSGNHKEALKWLNKAAEYETGIHSYNGKPYIGVATDEYLQSLELLAKLYFNGKDVEHNKDKAAKLVDELIKQVNVRINIRKIQATPDTQWRPDDFGSRSEQIQYYSNLLNSYMSKSAELIDLKRVIEDE